MVTNLFKFHLGLCKKRYMVKFLMHSISQWFQFIYS